MNPYLAILLIVLSVASITTQVVEKPDTDTVITQKVQIIENAKGSSDPVVIQTANNARAELQQIQAKQAKENTPLTKQERILQTALMVFSVMIVTAFAFYTFKDRDY